MNIPQIVKFTFKSFIGSLRVFVTFWIKSRTFTSCSLRALPINESVLPVTSEMTTTSEAEARHRTAKVAVTKIIGKTDSQHSLIKGNRDSTWRIKVFYSTCKILSKVRFIVFLPVSRSKLSKWKKAVNFFLDTWVKKILDNRYVIWRNYYWKWWRQFNKIADSTNLSDWNDAVWRKVDKRGTSKD